MKGTFWIAAALLCFASCANCGDDNNVAGNNVNNGTNNGPNNGTNNGTSNGTSNATNNGTSNNPNSVTNNVPMECTPEFEYDDWDVTADRRLIKACSPYIADDSIEITDGAMLLIDPGVEVQVPSGEWIRVQAGRLVANGADDDPIVFTSSAGSPASGSWLGIRFTSEAEAGNEISNAIVEYAGEDVFSQRGCITVDSGLGDGRITLTDTLFRECEQAGLAAPSPSFLELARLSFEAMDFGVSVGADVVGQIDEAFTYTDVNANAISSEDVTESATWVAQPVPYRVQQSIDVRSDSDPVLTLSAGLTLQFNNNEWLRVGSGEDGGLVIAGTEAEPVVLESGAGTTAPGDWLGIRLESNILGGTSISNMIIRHAGGDTFSTRGCVTIASDSTGRVSIDDSEFAECQQSGVGAVADGFGFDSFTGNVFRDNTIGMHLSSNAVSTVGTQTYVDTGANMIADSPVTRNGTWVQQDVPWRVDGSIDVGDASAPVLTIEAGVTLQFQDTEWLRVGASGEGGLIAQGTAMDPVVLQSASASPSAGDWLGIRFENGTLGGTLLEYVTVEHAGQNTFSVTGAVSVGGPSNGRIAIRNSTFNQCLQACIAARDGDAVFNEITSNTFRNSDYGLRLSPNGISSVTDSQTYDSVPANLLEGDTFSTTGTWVSQSVPWDVVDSIDVRDPTTAPILTIEAPNEFRFSASEWLRVGSGQNGGLVVNGTAAAPVVFTSRQAAPAPGDWLGIRFGDSTANGTLLDYVVVEYAGQDTFSQDGGVHITGGSGSSVAITNSTFQNNAQTDIFVGAGATPTLTNNTGTVTNQ